jgi:predicted CXXCH cytochrome family protein
MDRRHELMITTRLRLLLILLSTTFVFGSVLADSAYSAEENQCLTCHVKLKEKTKSVHAAIALGCSSCHVAVDGKTHPGQKGSIKLTQPMPGLCYNCHDESKFKGKSVHTPITSGMCTGCHDPHQSNYSKILLNDMPGLCYNCHDETKFKGKYGHATIGMCTGCHAPHASNASKLLGSEIPDVCYSCHEKTMFTKKSVHAVVSMPGGCSLCHTPHVSNDKAMLVQPLFELCTSCHANKSDGRHIVALTGKKIHPLKGVPDPATVKMKQVIDEKTGLKTEVRDRNNPSEREITCTTCHNPHSSDFRKLFPQKNMCARCHRFL